MGGRAGLSPPRRFASGTPAAVLNFVVVVTHTHSRWRERAGLPRRAVFTRERRPEASRMAHGQQCLHTHDAHPRTRSGTRVTYTSIALRQLRTIYLEHMLHPVCMVHSGGLTWRGFE